jgi:hypothetical protein
MLNKKIEILHVLIIFIKKITMSSEQQENKKVFLEFSMKLMVKKLIKTHNYMVNENFCDKLVEELLTSKSIERGVDYFVIDGERYNPTKTLEYLNTQIYEHIKD